MSDFINGIITAIENTGAGAALVTFIISVIPVIELRGAIPVGIGLGLDPWACFFLAVIGNFLPVPFIILFIRRIFAWMKRKSKFLGGIAKKFEERARSRWKTVQRTEFIALLLFVAIPLPGTGAWTGSLIAALMDMRLKKSLAAIAAGVLIAGIIVTLVSTGIFKAVGSLF